MSGTTRGRGRPPLADVTALRTVALDLLLERGYHNVTMTDIADVAGMSVRTLHRYFPTKADIVWSGLEESLGALRRALDRADPHLPPLEAMAQSVLAVFAEEAEDATFGRTRLRVIALNPELEATRPEIYGRWRDESVEFIARRLDMSPAEVIPRAAGAAVQTTIMQSLAWWATHEDQGSAAEVVARALRGLALLSRS